MKKSHLKLAAVLVFSTTIAAALTLSSVFVYKKDAENKQLQKQLQNQDNKENQKDNLIKQSKENILKQNKAYLDALNTQIESLKDNNNDLYTQLKAELDLLDTKNNNLKDFEKEEFFSLLDFFTKDYIELARKTASADKNNEVSIQTLKTLKKIEEDKIDNAISILYKELNKNNPSEEKYKELEAKINELKALKETIAAISSLEQLKLKQLEVDLKTAYKSGEETAAVFVSDSIKKIEELEKQKANDSSSNITDEQIQEIKQKVVEVWKGTEDYKEKENIVKNVGLNSSQYNPESDISILAISNVSFGKAQPFKGVEGFSIVDFNTYRQSFEENKGLTSYENMKKAIQAYDYFKVTFKKIWAYIKDEIDKKIDEFEKLNITDENKASYSTVVDDAEKTYNYVEQYLKLSKIRKTAKSWATGEWVENEETKMLSDIFIAIFGPTTSPAYFYETGVASNWWLNFVLNKIKQKHQELNKETQ
ncbi:hypothetical protein [Mycoplasma procyoni]|uniref:hypothetical protein n=1 Tax=Mycoplasma procyoni TaxID=568784 RepID=UPI00197B2FC5|nr:hypothetical protein [Mycoplasma procyoni]MBN3534499.1 hypothetical protein [Mycoplasma procyoni]